MTEHEITNVEAVKAHALDHYEDGGWDVIVECYDDDMLAERVGYLASPEDAIKSLADCEVAIWADRQADARNSAF